MKNVLSNVSRFFTSVVMAAAMMPLVQAANVTHSLPTVGTTTWSGASWTNGVPNAAGDIASFTGTAAGTTTLDVDVTIGVIKNLGTGGPGSWTISTDGTHAFTLDGTGLTAGNNPFGIAGEAALSLSTNAPFIINPNITIANTNLGIGTTGNSQITVNSAIAASTDQTINFRGGGSGGIALNGSIGTSGSGNITISNANVGTSSVQLTGVLGSKVVAVTQNSATSSMNINGDNGSYAGTTTLAQGAMSAINSTGTNFFTSFGSGALVLNGGTLSLRSNGNGTSNQTIVAGNNVTMGGDVTILVDRSSSVSGNTIQFNNLAIGANTLNVTGANSYKLQFSGTTTASGAATFNPTSAPIILGALTLGNSVGTGTATTITLGGTNTGNIVNGVVSNNPSDPTKVLALTKNNLSTWTLNGSAVSTYTGATTVNGGTLVLDFSNLATPTNLINSASPLTLGGGTLSLIGKASATSNQTLGNLTLGSDSGQSTIKFTSALVGTTTNLTLGNTWTRNAGSTLNIDLTVGTGNLGPKSVSSNVALTNGIIGGYATVTGTSFATITAGAVAAVSTSSLGTATNDGAVNYSTNSSVTHNAGAWAANSIVLNGGGLNIGGGTLTLTSGGLLNRGTTGGATDLISNGQLGATNSEVIIHSYAASTRLLEVSATISGGTGSLTKGGTSTLVLTGENTYTGNTVIGGGTLQIGNAGTAGGIVNSANVIMRPGTTLAYNATDASTVNNVTGGGIVNANSGTLTLAQSGSGLAIRTIGGVSGATIEFAGDGTGVTSLGDAVAGAISYLNVAGLNYKFTSGTVNLLDNARGSTSNIEIAGGTVNMVNNPLSMSGVASGTQTFTMSAGTLNANASNGVSGFNGAGGATQTGTNNSTFIGNQSGGIISVTNAVGRFDLGSTSTGDVTTYNLSGGTISQPGATAGMTLGADTGGSSMTTFNFSGGKLLQGTSIKGSQGTSARQAFVWTGGTLATFAYDATNLTSASGAVYSGNVGTLTNGGGILAPGDTGTAGRTSITGNYNVTTANAAYAVDVGGATAATVFQGAAGTYDQTTVSGTTVLNGRLNFGLINSYTPANDVTTIYRIINGNTAATSTITGTFTNLVTATSGNSRVVGADGLSSFLVAINNTAATATTGGLTSVGARTVNLGGYKATNTYTGAGTAWDTANAAAWANFDAGATASPSTQASGAIAQFADGTASTGAIAVSLNSTRNIQGVQFASAAGSRAYSINNGGSGAIILDNTSNAAAAIIADTSTSGTANAISVPITLKSNLGVSVTNAANNLTIGGAIGETLVGATLAKTGAGTLILSNANTYTGGTTISSGKLQLGAGSTSGSLSTTGAIVNNGNFTINRSNAVTQGTDFSAAAITGAGSLTQAGTGTTTLNAANTYANGTTVSAGTLALSGSGTFGSGGLSVSGGTADLGTKSIANTLGALTGGGVISNGTITNNSGTYNLQNGTVSAVLAGSNALTKTTGSTVTLSGANTYSGGTVVSSGKLVVNNTTGSGTGSGAVTINSGATLGGSGFIDGATTVAGTLSPGNSPGLLTTGAQTWVDGGSYNWQVVDATGVAGTGFDSVALSSGGLNLTGLTTGGFTINLWSLSSTGPDVNGDATHFDNTTNHSWTLVSNTGDLTSIVGSVFTVNIAANNGTTGFTNDLGGGSFTVVGGVNSLDLVFTGTAIPEPSTYAAFLGAACLGLAVFRRRQARR